MPVAWACNFVYWYMNNLRFLFLFCLQKAISKAAVCVLVLLGEKHLHNSSWFLDQPRPGSILWSTSSTGLLAQHIATSRISRFPTLQAFCNCSSHGSNLSGSSPSYMGMALNILLKLPLMGILYKLGQSYGLGFLSSCQSIHVSSHGLVHISLGL